MLVNSRCGLLPTNACRRLRRARALYTRVHEVRPVIAAFGVRVLLAQVVIGASGSTSICGAAVMGGDPGPDPSALAHDGWGKAG
jgi:hypothetical protein